MGFQIPRPFDHSRPPREEKPNPEEVERLAPHIGEDAINAAVPVETGADPIAVKLVPPAEQPAQTPPAPATSENGDIKHAA